MYESKQTTSQGEEATAHRRGCEPHATRGRLVCAANEHSHPRQPALCPTSPVNQNPKFLENTERGLYFLGVACLYVETNGVHVARGNLPRPENSSFRFQRRVCAYMHASRAPSPGISSVFHLFERPQRLALNPSFQRQRVAGFSAQTRWCGRAFAVQGGKNQTSTRGCCVIPASDQARAPDKRNRNIHPRQQRTQMLQIPEAHGSHRGNPQ